MDHYTEACELIGDVLDDSAEVGLNDEGKVRVAQVLSTLALVDALRLAATPRTWVTPAMPAQTMRTTPTTEAKEAER